jgi:hypothetical protein
MPHPLVITRDMGAFIHIFIDGGPDALCDDCCCDCNEVEVGARFGSYVVCPECAMDRIRCGEIPDEISRDGETFKTFCDRLNAPLRARMEAMHAETN